MKATHIIYIALAALLPTACADKEEYRPGDPVAAVCPGVYFDTENPTNMIFVPDEDASVDITIMRSKGLDALSVPLKLTADAEGIVCPESVQFEQGSSSATFQLKFNDIPQKKLVHFSVTVPEKFTDFYAENLFCYETTALMSQWEAANKSGEPVKFYFVDTDYNAYASNTKVTSSVFQPVESEMEVLPGAGLIRIKDFVNTGLQLTLSLTPSPYSTFEGYYRVSPVDNFYTLAEAYESDAYGDDWYNAWYFCDPDSEDYPVCSLTTLDGDAATLDLPMVFWYSDSYAYEYSYMVCKNENRIYNTVAMGFSGTPDSNLTLPGYFYVYFRWDGDSSL